MSLASLAKCAFLALPLAAMTAIPTAGTAEAQVRSQSGSLRVPSPGPLPAQFREMDRNNDGVISREEWRDTLQSFRANDRNRDNVLSGDELRMSISPNGRFEEADDEPEGSDEIDEWTAEAFANLDRDRDTRISRTEWPYALATFRRVDRNRDNVISRTEFLGTAATNGDRRDRFVTLDTDNNGRIERDEWRDSDDAFDWLDRNADGVLSRSEVVGDTSTTTTPTDTTPVGAFASLDNNQNGVITRDEWSGSRASFNQLDANRDGVLSRREFRTTDAPASTPAGTGTRVVRVDAMQQWIDSGIFVRAGDLVTFDADGTVRMSPDPNDAATPAGSLTGRHAPNAPVRTALAGALVMRIGDGPVQYAGARGSFTALSSGQLHLGVNDDHMADNSGEFRVTVTVRPR